ncbi:MAG: phosphoribosylformylglycinamidine cyclo-ligase [Gammaproteobacteria bacterium RIFCSPHIGHO2_12_FULL_38_14]|nr:MAG: phosphoribosylformylglycinamidine cyclo-ligase [Gammaproteobacteria bacterium RIFCSPHIGHO2_12_FULL_38_14]
MTIDYKSAGVDIAAGNEAVRRIKQAVESTFSPQVLTPIGSFGAMFDLKPIMQQYRHPVLVQSIDGVGTKMMVAKMMQKFDTIGEDLVSATTNDIIVLGAKPLTLLDYIANDKLKPEIIEQIVLGMAKACRENDISLVGGETAEMPGTYLKGEHDLVGVITGVVEKDQAILGKNISAGDAVMAFPSSGLHTNGYSLARKLFFEVGHDTVDTYLPELSQTVGEALLVPHINYTRPVLKMLADQVPIKGMAHITGGGLLENIPRILPDGTAVEIQKNDCPHLPLFDVLKQIGQLDDQESYRTFNMGIGLVMIVPEEALIAMQHSLQAYPQYPLYRIGRVVSGARDVRII